MKKIIIHSALLLFISVLCHGQGSPHIGIFPPQMHQQICLESTFTRYLQIFNTGDSTLFYNANLTADVGWVTTTPIGGQIEPGDTSLIEFDFNSAGLPLDNYFDTLHISSNDPDNPELNVLTMLHVQVLNILINPEPDSICLGCSTLLKTSVIGCSDERSFSWASDPTGFTSDEKSPVVSPQVTTIYTITVTDGNYSDQKSTVIKVTPSNGINDNRLVSHVSVFPNPCKGACVLKFKSEYNGNGLITISDLTGKVMRTLAVNFIVGVNEIQMNTGSVDPGIYFLFVQGDRISNHPVHLFSKIVIH